MCCGILSRRPVEVGYAELFVRMQWHTGNSTVTVAPLPEDWRPVPGARLDRDRPNRTAAGHAVAFLPDLFWVDRLPGVGLRLLPNSGYRDIICSVRAGTSNHPSVTATTNALQAACSEADEAIAAHLAAAR